MKAYAYLRVSGKGQLEGDGFPRQREATQQFAETKSYEIVRTFEEKATCGATELDDREAMQEMLEAMADSGVTVVIIERLDRLARDLMVQENIIKDFLNRGYEIVSTLEPDLCTNDPTRKFIRQVLGAAAEWDRAMIVAKLRVARQRMKKATGRCEGVKPYGLLEGEDKVIERMQALRKNGCNYETIAEQLDKEKMPPRNGGTWNPIVIGRILKRSN